MMDCVRKMVLVPIGKYTQLVQGDVKDKKHAEIEKTDLNNSSDNDTSSLTGAALDLTNVNDVTTSTNSIKSDDVIKSENNIKEADTRNSEAIVNESPEEVKEGGRRSKVYRGNIKELLAKFKDKIYKRSSKLKRLGQTITSASSKKKKVTPDKKNIKDQKKTSIKWMSL